MIFKCKIFYEYNFIIQILIDKFLKWLNEKYFNKKINWIMIIKRVTFKIIKHFIKASYDEKFLIWRIL